MTGIDYWGVWGEGANAWEVDNVTYYYGIRIGSCVVHFCLATTAVIISGDFTDSLPFRGPCIVIYSYNKTQRDALFLKFILIKDSTCFGQIYCPSSGVSHHCIHRTGICHASSVDCLLARLGYSILTSLADSQHN